MRRVVSRRQWSNSWLILWETLATIAGFCTTGVLLPKLIERLGRSR